MHQNDATCSKVIVYSQSPLKNGSSQVVFEFDFSVDNVIIKFVRFCVETKVAG